MRQTGISPSLPHLLTVDKTTYTKDVRVKASFMYPNNWRLEIKDVGPQDSGLYNCQLSTHPPIGLFTSVKVTGRLVRILPSSLSSSWY